MSPAFYKYQPQPPQRSKKNLDLYSYSNSCLSEDDTFTIALTCSFCAWPFLCNFEHLTAISVLSCSARHILESSVLSRCSQFYYFGLRYCLLLEQFQQLVLFMRYLDYQTVYAFSFIQCVFNCWKSLPDFCLDGGPHISFMLLMSAFLVLFAASIIYSTSHSRPVRMPETNFWRTIELPCFYMEYQTAPDFALLLTHRF